MGCLLAYLDAVEAQARRPAGTMTPRALTAASYSKLPCNFRSTSIKTLRCSALRRRRERRRQRSPVWLLGMQTEDRALQAVASLVRAWS